MNIQWYSNIKMHEYASKNCTISHQQYNIKKTCKPKQGLISIYIYIYIYI